MKASRTRIAQTVADRSLRKGIDRKLSREVAAYLLSEGRVSELSSILRDVQVAWAGSGYIDVTATSAHPLTPAIKASITKQIKQLYPDATDIVIQEERDSEVIGGVRLRFADKQFDASVEAKLGKFRQLTMKKG